MFRDTRRANKAISRDATKELLKNGRRGILSVLGDDDYPYGVPMNYLYVDEDDKIYFHCSLVGHKVDAIKRHDKVCFTVYGEETVKEESWAPYIQSAIVFGRCKIVEDKEKALNIIRELAGKYYPDKKLIEEEIKRSFKAVNILELEIEHLSGKEIQEK